MRIDGRGQRGQHAGQHQAARAGRQQRIDAGRKSEFPARDKALAGRTAYIEGKDDQQREPDQQPQQAAHDDLGDCEHNRRDARLAVVRAGHGALGQIAGPVRIHLIQPLQANHGDERQ